MSGKCELWKEWTFSSSIQEKVDKFVADKIVESSDSDISRQWLFLRNFEFQSLLVNSESEKVLCEDVLSGEGCSCDIESLVHSAVEMVESNSVLNESQFNNLSKSSLSEVFCKIRSALSETGLINFCKMLVAWNDQKLINICFDHIVLNMLKEKEEAKLSTIFALTEVAKVKPDDFCKCITKLLLDESSNFTDAELLESVFTVMPNDKKDLIIMALIKEESFKESNWHLLHALCCKSTTISFTKIIAFMNCKCEQYASSQAFARLLVHICKNLESNVHKDKLQNIIEKNKTLLKKQALKYLLSLEN